MGNGLTKADLALVQAAIDEANASMGRALAVIENAAALVERESAPCGGCQGEDFGDCAGCGQAAEAWWIDGEPEGRVIGSGGLRDED